MPDEGVVDGRTHAKVKTKTNGAKRDAVKPCIAGGKHLAVGSFILSRSESFAVIMFSGRLGLLPGYLS